MTQTVRICRYGCRRELGEFDLQEKKYHELDGRLHTRERCESLKITKFANKKGDRELSLDILLKKLESIGIKIDLEKLRNVQ